LVFHLIRQFSDPILYNALIARSDDGIAGFVFELHRAYGGVFGGKYPISKIARSSSDSESTACALEIMSAAVVCLPASK
jgi:hypothetical protein